MRAIWSGTISFGLINIPVKLFPAVKDSSLDLDMLDAHDHSNIRFKRVNENTGKEVPYEHIVKGYKVDDQYVILDKKDFENADAKKNKVIEILNFAKENEIDTIYYEQPYYLQPDKAGEKAYALLRDALADTSKVGVTTFVLRNKETLAILKPHGKVIVLNRMRFNEEIRDPEELDLPTVSKAKEKEQEMASKLIEQLTEKFSIAQYKDTYTAKLLSVIKEKAKGKPVKRSQMKVVHTKSSHDLMSMLKASLKTKAGAKAKKAS
jgi:DNA end-binding protein Ku